MSIDLVRTKSRYVRLLTPFGSYIQENIVKWCTLNEQLLNHTFGGATEIFMAAINAAKRQKKHEGGGSASRTCRCLV